MLAKEAGALGVEEIMVMEEEDGSDGVNTSWEGNGVERECGDGSDGDGTNWWSSVIEV